MSFEHPLVRVKPHATIFYFGRVLKERIPIFDSVNQQIMKAKIFIVAASLSFLSLSSRTFGQVPSGNWSGSSVSATTDSSVGVGISSPRAWVDIMYCPPFGNDQTGLLISKNNCNQSMPAFNPANTDIIGGGIIGPDTSGESQGQFILPYSFLTGNSTTATSPLYSGTSPLIWARIEDPPGTPSNFLTVEKFDTKFIVMPDGSTGINIANPRAALDVRGSQGLNRPAFIVGSRAIGTGSYSGNLFQYHTQQVHFVPILETDAYNVIVQNDDQGMFFSDGEGNKGANKNGAFVIAPWAEDSDTLVGGLRIDSLGNLEVHGFIRASKVTVDPKWWSDFVFEDDYELMSLEELDSFITRNNHLPDVPSEKEVMSGQVDLLEMQAIQQQKIEELTLYVIQLQKLLLEMEAKLEESQNKKL